jgi:hypothetical protein
MGVILCVVAESKQEEIQMARHELFLLPQQSYYIGCLLCAFDLSSLCTLAYCAIYSEDGKSNGRRVGLAILIGPSPTLLSIF